MFIRISALLAIAIAIAIAAAASARMERHVLAYRSSDMAGECNTGTLSCCNSFSNASDIKNLLDNLSMQYQETDNVGIDCVPFNIYGAGQAATCQQQPVCCTNNTYRGFINVGCSPFDFN